MTRRIVVIGGGPAAVFAALEAKKRDSAAEVTLVTEEACEPYEKPPLSKAVLLGKSNPEDAPIAGPGELGKHGVTVKTGTAPLRSTVPPIKSSPPAEAALPYDALVIATGSLMKELPVLPVLDAARALPAHRGAFSARSRPASRTASISWWSARD